MDSDRLGVFAQKIPKNPMLTLACYRECAQF